jgi:hypothetical protein
MRKSVYTSLNQNWEIGTLIAGIQGHGTGGLSRDSGGLMIRFRILKRTPALHTGPGKSLASEFVRLRMAGKTDSEALRILFDMVTSDGPIPEIERQEGSQAS